MFHRTAGSASKHEDCLSDFQPAISRHYPLPLLSDQRISNLQSEKHVVTSLASCVSHKLQLQLYFAHFVTSYALLLKLHKKGLKATGTVVCLALIQLLSIPLWAASVPQHTHRVLGDACFLDNKFQKNHGSNKYVSDDQLCNVRRVTSIVICTAQLTITMTGMHHHFTTVYSSCVKAYDCLQLKLQSFGIRTQSSCSSL